MTKEACSFPSPVLTSHGTTAGYMDYIKQRNVLISKDHKAGHTDRRQTTGRQAALSEYDNHYT